MEKKNHVFGNAVLGAIVGGVMGVCCAFTGVASVAFGTPLMGTIVGAFLGIGRHEQDKENM